MGPDGSLAANFSNFAISTTRQSIGNYMIESIRPIGWPSCSFQPMGEKYNDRTFAIKSLGINFVNYITFDGGEPADTMVSFICTGFGPLTPGKYDDALCCSKEVISIHIRHTRR